MSPTTLIPATGRPSRPPSSRVVAAAAESLRDGATHYTERAGVAAVRSGLARRLGGATGLDADRVVVTASAEEGLFLALRGLCQVTDRVLVVADGRFADGILLRSLRLEPVLWSPRRSLGEAVTAAAASVLLWHSAEGDLDALEALLTSAAEVGLAVIVVETLTGRSGGWASLAARPGVVDRAVVVGDLDAAGLRDWGVGYVAGPAEAIGPMVDLKQGLNICTAGVSQYAALATVEKLPWQPSASRSRPGRPGAPPRAWSRAASVSVADEGTRQRYELLDLLTRTPGAISLGRGDPDLATPAPIVEAAIAAMRATRRQPAHPLGLPQLRAAIAGKLWRENGIRADPENEILVTTGGQEAIFLVLQSLLSPGDEILMPSPRYTAYDVAVNVAGGRIVPIAPRGPLDFELDARAIEASIGPRTRALLIISPGNPTAAVAGAQRLREVADVARRHQLTVISDEMYERIVYDGVEHVSMASLPGMEGRTITVGGFSKAYSMTGWRVGYLVAPAPIVAAARSIKSLWSGPTSIICQHAALAALSADQDLAAEAIGIYARRRTIVLDALAAMGIRHAAAEGAFYVFFDVSELGVPSYEISRRLLIEAGVFLYPGSGFGEEWAGHMRLAWLAPEDRLTEAMERMAGWLPT